MERILEDYPHQPYSNSLRCHKSGLSYADSCIKRVASLLYNESIIEQFDLLTYNEIEGLLSEALETLTVILNEAEANAPGYWRKGPAQPQRLKPLPVAKESP
ncbi:hypothetical protein GBK04_03315 [Cytophagaceae bacterium SJW1-29]|uniref:Four helix bundle protein n=2 Tax=Salmonirosea aquatica TaxID=2654236 RepID=A0A7C9BMW9_9BACT|nr:hypothetical protein [Cytophagaceae bacterium SJW1-29]